MTVKRAHLVGHGKQALNEATFVCLCVSGAALFAGGSAVLVGAATRSPAVMYLAWCGGLYLVMALVSLAPWSEVDPRPASLPHPFSDQPAHRQRMAQMVAAACRTRPWSAAGWAEIDELGETVA